MNPSPANAESRDDDRRRRPGVVVLTFFELPGGPSERREWAERFGLDQRIPFPQGPAPLLANGRGMLAALTGPGVGQAAAAAAALGHDPRFDFRDSYWLLAGLAGGDPAAVGLGTAAWARWVVDGDSLCEIDARETPERWPYGRLPIGADTPDGPAPDLLGPLAFRLNERLAEWAHDLTRDNPTPDTPGLARARAGFPADTPAAAPPRVTLGDSLSAGVYFHGERLTRWARDWVRRHTGGEGLFAMSNMEDAGVLRALAALDAAGRADLARVMVLRTAANFTAPPPGGDPVASLNAPFADDAEPALDAAVRAGGRVAEALLDGNPP